MPETLDPIILSQLDPPTVASPVPPRVMTAAPFRDGTRSEPPVVITPEQWLSILRREGSGTKDPAINYDDLHNGNLFNYLGSFRIPYFHNAASGTAGSQQITGITYCPPNGNNGSNGSLFVGAWNCAVAEIEIPNLKTDPDHLELNPSTVLQDWVAVYDHAPSGNSATQKNRTGWMKYENGNLYIATHNNYDNGNNTHDIVVCTTPGNLSNGTYLGAFNAWPFDYGGEYLIDVPAEWQQEFGFTHLAGIAQGISISTRASFGHSLVGIDLSDLDSDPENVSTELWTYYSINNPISGYTTRNQGILDYYAPLAWATTEYSLSDFYDANDNRVPDWGGIDSVELPAFTALPISETGRTTTLEQFPLPSNSVRSHVNVSSSTRCAFIIPGTETVCFIGRARGMRYGLSYKGYSIETGPTGSNPPGGYNPISETDQDPYIWLMNLNDVKDRVNTYDPTYFYSGPWGNSADVAGNRPIQCGCFDSATGKLYLLTTEHFQNQFVNQNVVSVYQTGVIE